MCTSWHKSIKGFFAQHAYYFNVTNQSLCTAKSHNQKTKCIHLCFNRCYSKKPLHFLSPLVVEENLWASINGYYRPQVLATTQGPAVSKHSSKQQIREQLSQSQILVLMSSTNVLFLTIHDPRVGHTMDVLSPFISVLCHSISLCHSD